MIAYLNGEVLHGGDGWAVLLVSDVGYKIFPVGFSALAGSRLEVHILDYIREDRRELFAFESRELMELFQKLIDISGVGPKLAQKILASGDAEALQRNIVSGEIGFFTSISGVGKKTAQKIILELKGVIVSVESASPIDNDTLDALLSLGYQKRDVQDIISELTADSPEERIKEALRMLS